MSKEIEQKQKTAEQFYSLLKDELSFLDRPFGPDDTPLYTIGGWPRGPSGNEFQGFRAFQLMTTSSAVGFTNPLWMDTEQLADRDIYIKKDERAQVRFNRSKQNTTLSNYAIPMFNADQVKLNHTIDHTPKSSKQRYQALEAMIKQSGARIEFEPKNAPYYERSSDVIYMAPLSAYGNDRGGPRQYYQDMVHCLTDWATHPSRGNTIQPDDSSLESEQFSKYRLRKQLAMLTIAARMGVDYEPDHVSGWQQNYIDKKPNYRELESAMDDAATICNVLNIPALVHEAISQKKTLERATPSIEVMHIADKPSPTTAKKIKRGIEQAME